MTPKASRLHPYRATSNVETPGATQSYSSYAGPGLLPAGIDPPPWQTYFDHCGLLSVAIFGASEWTWHALFTALCGHNFRCATAGELEALVTWARLFPPDEATAIQSFTATSDYSTSYPMGHPYDSFGFGVPLRWPHRWCLSSSWWLDHHAAAGRVPPWLENSTI